MKSPSVHRWFYQTQVRDLSLEKSSSILRKWLQWCLRHLERHISTTIDRAQNRRCRVCGHSTLPNNTLTIPIHRTFPFVLQALEPLRKAGYLTTFANGTLTQSVITVVGTGNTPLELVKAQLPRDFFYDAPLDQLTNPSLNTTFDNTLSPLASTDYAEAIGWNGFGNISEDQLANLTKFVQNAHDRGIKARFWDIPAWPIYARNKIWTMLLENGVDWLNADDLQAASEF